MSDLKSEDLKNEDSEQAEKDIVLSMEKTESGTVEQRTRIDGHHHHKHHSKLYYKFKRTKHKIKKHFRKKKTRRIYIAVASLLGIVLIVASINAQNISNKNLNNESSGVSSGNGVNEGAYIEVFGFEEEPVLVSSVIEKYMDSDNTDYLYEALINANADVRYDISKPVSFKTAVSDLPSGVTAENTKVLISDDPEFKNSISVNRNSGYVDTELLNLKTGTVYYYSVDTTLSDGTTISESGSFKTALTPRVLSISGAVNVRDIGGWRTTDGKIIRQGLLYRGSEIDGAYRADFCLTDSGIVSLTKDLGVICDFDLRGSSKYISEQSPLGASINHLQFASPQYSEVFDASGEKEIKAVFSALADKDNYPMYMHCTLGLDRTGTVCYILEALLGMSEADLLKEFELSSLYYTNIRTRDSNFDLMKFIYDFDALDGASTQEKAQNYLLSIGVTQDEINSIKTIFLG